MSRRQRDSILRRILPTEYFDRLSRQLSMSGPSYQSGDATSTHTYHQPVSQEYATSPTDIFRSHEVNRSRRSAPTYTDNRPELSNKDQTEPVSHEFAEPVEASKIPARQQERVEQPSRNKTESAWSPSGFVSRLGIWWTFICAPCNVIKSVSVELAQAFIRLGRPFRKLFYMLAALALLLWLCEVLVLASICRIPVVGALLRWSDIACSTNESGTLFSLFSLYAYCRYTACQWSVFRPMVAWTGEPCPVSTTISTNTSQISQPPVFKSVHSNANDLGEPIQQLLPFTEELITAASDIRTVGTWFLRWSKNDTFANATFNKHITVANSIQEVAECSRELVSNVTLFLGTMSEHLNFLDKRYRKWQVSWLWHSSHYVDFDLNMLFMTYLQWLDLRSEQLAVGASLCYDLSDTLQTNVEMVRKDHATILKVAEEYLKTWKTWSLSLSGTRWREEIKRLTDALETEPAKAYNRVINILALLRVHLSDVRVETRHLRDAAGHNGHNLYLAQSIQRTDLEIIGSRLNETLNRSWDVVEIDKPRGTKRR